MAVGRPKGVKDSTPRKQMEPRGSRDGFNYTYADSGCIRATGYLGERSSCLSCPYDECLYKERDDKSA